MGGNGGSLRDFEGFPEPVFHVPFLTEVPPNPYEDNPRIILCSVTLVGLLYKQLNVLLNCKDLQLQFALFSLLGNILISKLYS